MPTDNGGDGYGYDLAVNPKKNVLLTSSFTGYANYMRPLGELVKDAEAMKHFGSTMVAWDLKAMKPKKVFSVPGAPLEIRWSLKPGRQLGGHRRRAHLEALAHQAGQRRASGRPRRSATIGDPAKIPLPVDISITPRRQGAVGQHVHGRHHALLRPEQTRGARSRPTRRSPASRST